MTTTRAELELAAVYLKRAEEMATFYHQDPELIALIGKLKRGVQHVQKQLGEKNVGPLLPAGKQAEHERTNEHGAILPQSRY